MFSCFGLPAILVRSAVELGLLAVAVLIVMRKHRRAGLVMASGCLLALLVGLGVPMLEVAGLMLFGQLGSGGSGAEMFGVCGFLLLPYLTPLAQALNLAAIGVAVAMLANRLPDEEREWSHDVH